MSRTALLDINVLIALFDPDHVHHELAHDWFDDNRTGGWATCPVTENGFVRVLANPAYGGAVASAAALVERLRQFCASGDHAFWADSVSFRDRKLFDPNVVVGHRQLTDVYLLGLACKMGGRLVTFDRGVPLRAVSGAQRRHLEVIAAVER